MIDLVLRPVRPLVLLAVLWSASTALAPVAHATPLNLVGNPSFETGTAGWKVYNGSMIERVSGGTDGEWALLVQGEDDLTTFGVNDSPNWIETVRAVTSRYRFTARVRSDGSNGSARLQIREYKDGSQRGSTVKSPLVPLTPEWQEITGDYVVTTLGSTLDFQILDVPVSENESFEIDQVSIIEVFPDAPPVVTVDSLVVVEEAQTFGLLVTAADPDDEPIMALAADLSGLPAGAHASFTPDPTNASGTFEWTPTFDDAGGPYIVRFFAGNGQAGMATAAITVQNVDRPPVLEAPLAAITRDSTELVIEVTAVDPDGEPIDHLLADLSQLPGSNASFVTSGNGDEGTLRWTPALGASGQFPVRLIASNAGADTTVVTITVTRIEHAPVLVTPATIHVREGEAIDLPIAALDPDGDAFVSLSANLAALPGGSGAAFTPAANHASGRLTWSPGWFQAGSYPIAFTAASGAGVSAGTVTAHLTIEVENVDRAPIVTAPASVIVFEGHPLTIDFTAADPDSEAIASLVADLTGMPAGHGAHFDVSANRRAARLTWTPSHAEIGVYPITIIAENALVVSAATTIVVRPPNQPPVAVLTLSPAVTSAPALVTANASGSTDPEDPIVSYEFDFGGGIVVGPQPSPIASAMLATAGVYPVRVIVTDAFGASDTASAKVVTHLANLCTNPGFENTTTGWIGYGGATLARVNGAGRTGTWAYQASRASGAAWGFNDSPDVVPATAGPGRTYRVIAWVRSVADHGQATLRVQEFLGTALKGVTRISAPVTLSDQWQMLSVDYVVTTPGTRLDLKVLDDSQVAGARFLVDDVQVLLLPLGDQPPLVTAPASVTAIAGLPLAITVAAADPDGQPLATVSASLAALPPGNDAHWTPDAAATGGTLTWTPRAADVGPVAYVVTVTAANGLATTVPIEIVVAPAPLPNLCGNPGFENSASGWMAYGSGTSVTRVNAGRSGRFAVQVAHPSATGWGLNDQLDIVSNAVAGRTYRFSAWVRSPASAGKVRMRVQEFLGTTQQGVTAETPELTLTPQWQRIALSYTATVAGTRLDMKIVDAPVAVAESFLVDDVEVLLMPAGDRPAAMSVPTSMVVAKQQPMTLCVTAADPDGDPITSLTADLSALPAGHTATFTPGPGNRTGILSWTPGPADARATPYVVTFIAGNLKNAVVATAITVTATSYANLCANPGFETGLAGWAKYGPATLKRVAGGHSGGYALRMGTAAASSFGCDDSPNVVASVGAAGERYRFSAWVRSDSSTCPVRLRVYEMAGSVQLGATTLSYEVPAASTWQLVTVDHTTLAVGSTLSLRVTMSPDLAGQSFVVDDLAVQRVPAGAALMAAAPAETEVMADDAGESVETPAAADALEFSTSFAPNPLRGEGVLRFTLPEPGPVHAELFDAAGRRVRTLIDEPRMRAGRHAIDLAARQAGLGPGVYFYRVEAGTSGSRSGRVVVLD